MTDANASAALYGRIVSLLIEVGKLTETQAKYALRVQSKIKSEKSLLEIIRELAYISDEEIRQVLQEKSPHLRIGDFLVEMGIIRSRDLTLALDLQAKEGHTRKLGEVLVAHNLIEERALIRVLSLQLGFPFIEPDQLKIDPALFSRGSVKAYEQHFFIPVRMEASKVLVAFADPLDKRDIDAAIRAMHLPVIPAIATKPSIKAAIEHLNPQHAAGHALSETSESVVQIVDTIIIEAIQATDVSDIHIEPLSDRLRVRFRLDGVMVLHRDYPLALAPSLTSRIKVLCKADIAERRRHQAAGSFLIMKATRRTSGSPFTPRSKAKRLSCGCSTEKRSCSTSTRSGCPAGSCTSFARMPWTGPAGSS